jgi:hypothetical protein
MHHCTHVKVPRYSTGESETTEDQCMAIHNQTTMDRGRERRGGEGRIMA